MMNQINTAGDFLFIRLTLHFAKCKLRLMIYLNNKEKDYNEKSSRCKYGYAVRQGTH